MDVVVLLRHRLLRQPRCLESLVVVKEPLRPRDLAVSGGEDRAEILIGLNPASATGPAPFTSNEHAAVSDVEDFLCHVTGIRPRRPGLGQEASELVAPDKRPRLRE